MQLTSVRQVPLSVIMIIVLLVSCFSQLQRNVQQLPLLIFNVRLDILSTLAGKSTSA